MAQLVFKMLVPGTESTWQVIERVGEYNSNVGSIPRIGETVILLLDNANFASAYKVYDIEHVYAMVFNEFKLYHISLYVEPTTARDSEKYVAKKARSRLRSA